MFESTKCCGILVRTFEREPLSPGSKTQTGQGFWRNEPDMTEQRGSNRSKGACKIQSEGTKHSWALMLQLKAHGPMAYFIGNIVQPKCARSTVSTRRVSSIWQGVRQQRTFECNSQSTTSDAFSSLVSNAMSECVKICSNLVGW